MIRVPQEPQSKFQNQSIPCRARENGITIQYIQPGKSMQNGYIERLNRVYREAVVDVYLYFDLYQVKQLTAEWMDEHNCRGPHEALNNHTPEEWKNKVVNNETTLT